MYGNFSLTFDTFSLQVLFQSHQLLVSNNFHKFMIMDISIIACSHANECKTWAYKLQALQ